MKNITLRHVGQWALVLVLAFFWFKALFFNDHSFNFEACCPFGGLQAVTTFFVNGVLACSMEGMQVVMAGILVLSTIFISKLFCGYVCPIGTVSEGVGRLGRRFRIPKFEAGGIMDIVLRSLKYILLFITFYYTLKSNDLFCKKFDPFFATVSFFGEDVTTWMAILAILLLVAGAIFYKQFWCRYLCPLGAISNAFKYFYVFVVMSIIVIIFHQADISINLFVVLATTTILAYTLEIIGLSKRTGFQLLRITRDENLCIDCGLCDKKCPQGIKVSKMKLVNHPDCNLCTECMGVCPNDENAIGLNGSTKFRWLPILITVIFIMAGIILGTNTSIPTIDTKWGNKEEMERSSTFEMAGIKNVKCYGSSMTFVNQMKKVPGITGAATYIRDHRVVLQYDTTKLTAADVHKSLFNPVFIDIRQPANEAEIQLVDFYIENFFDQLDVVFIANLAKEVDGIYSFKTYYGNPVKVRFFAGLNTNVDSLKARIENSDLVYSTQEESFSSKGLYTVANVERNDTIYTGFHIKKMAYPAFKRAFNNRSQYSNSQLASVVFPIKRYPKNSQHMPYLINHLGKADPYIVGLISQYSLNGPVAVVFYVKGKTTPASIAGLMLSQKLTIHYDNGISEKIVNPYTFELPKSLSINKQESEEKNKNKS